MYFEPTIVGYVGDWYSRSVTKNDPASHYGFRWVSGRGKTSHIAPPPSTFTLLRLSPGLYRPSYPVWADSYIHTTCALDNSPTNPPVHSALPFGASRSGLIAAASFDMSVLLLGWFRVPFETLFPTMTSVIPVWLAILLTEMVHMGHV